MRILLLFVFLFTFHPAQSHDTLSVPRLGLYAALAPGPDIGGAEHAGVSFIFGKHEMLAGMLFSHLLNDTVHWYPGIAAGYRFYPWGTQKRVRFFLSFDFEFFQKKLEEHLTGPPDLPDTWVMYSQLTGYYLGAGCRVNILPNLFFGINLDAGIGNTIQDYYYRYSDGRELRDDTNDDFASFSMTGRVALTYHFLPLKRKAN